MGIGTVVLLPPAQLPGSSDGGWPARRELAAELMAYGIKVLVVADAPDSSDVADARMATANWVAHNAITLGIEQPEKPVLLVASGAAGSMLPAIGFAQKASRRPVAGYVIIDGMLPKAGAADWPDAPVTYVSTSAAAEPQGLLHQAELRGWTVESDADPAQILRAITSE